MNMSNSIAFPDNVILYDDFESALLGFGRVMREGALHDVAIYSYERMAEKLLSDFAGTEHADDEIAVDEYLQFNVLGGYLGPNTPVVVIQGWFDVTPQLPDQP